MANERDDDLLNSDPNFYEDDEGGEFQLPDGQDDDVLGSDIELTDEDVADISDSDYDGDDFFKDPETHDEQMGEEGGLDDLDASDFAKDSTSYDGEGQSEESVQDEAVSNDEQPASTGLGWKAWAGLATFAIVASAGLAYVVLPSNPAPAAAQQTAPALPPVPPPASSSNSTPQETASGARVQSQPIEVSPFPGAPEAGIPDAADMANQQRMASESDVTMAGNPIPDPRLSQIRDREPVYLAGLEEQRQDFASVASIADQNMFRITQMQERFDQFENVTNNELGDLDRRVTDLENRLKSGAGVMASDNNKPDTPSPKKAVDQAPAKVAAQATTQAPTDKDSSENSGFVYKIPKTPAEIKALQQKLKDFGYRPGAIDGILGDQTRWAIRRLQQEHGLPVNGWLSAETMMAVENPKRFSGTYPETKKNAPKKAVAKKADRSPAGGKMVTPTGETHRWFVRGVTPTRAIVYRQDGMSYAVRVGSEIPGMGQVTALDTDNVQVVTAKGTIARR